MSSPSFETRRTQANLAVRQLADSLYTRFRSKLGDDAELPEGGVAWRPSDSLDQFFGHVSVAVAPEKDPWAFAVMKTAQNLAVNAAFRCHHGPVAIQDDETAFTLVLFSRGTYWRDVRDEGFRKMHALVTAFMRLLTSKDLATLRQTIDLDTARMAAACSFREEAQRRLKDLLTTRDRLNPCASSPQSLGEQPRDAPASEEHRLCLATMLASLTDGPHARQLLAQHASHPTVAAIAAQHDSWIGALRSGDGSSKQAMFADLLRNKPQGQLLLLFGIPEVDWLIPSFEPVKFSPAVATQLDAAWRSMSAMLHVQLPDYASAETNIVKAVEWELLESYFRPFFEAHRPPRGEDHDRQRFGRLYELGGRWPDRKPTLGEMRALLALWELPDTEPTTGAMATPPSYLKAWVRFLGTERCATVRPSLLDSLGEFASLRNPDTHGGHSPTTRDRAIALRVRAWCILTHVAQERANSPLVERRRESGRATWQAVPEHWR